jgi:2-haloacid dehalogenase
MLDFTQFECLTFDCYGTMINWETGILAALRPILERHGVKLSDDEVLRAYGEFEPAQQRRGYRKYRDILQAIVVDFGDRYSFRPSLDEIESLPNSIAEWWPFPDTVAALRRLKKKFKLAVISNIDDDLFAHSARRLKVPFDYVITAQQARSYKPSHNNFKLALERIGLPKEKILHVAQSLHHDIKPCNELGIHSVWINRKGRHRATQDDKAKPDLEVPDLKTFANLALE